MFWFYSCFFLVWCVQNSEADCPPIVSREEWGSMETSYNLRDSLIHPIELVIIKQSNTRNCDNDSSCAEILKDLERIHLDIGYSFLVGSNGKIYEGRGWHQVGSHTPGYNNRSIGIAIFGYYEKQKPTTKVLNSIRALIKCGVDEELLKPNASIVSDNRFITTIDSIKTQLEHKSKAATELILTTSKEIDHLFDIRNGIVKLLNNITQLAEETVNYTQALSINITEKANLYSALIDSEFSNTGAPISKAIDRVSKNPETQECLKTITKRLNRLNAQVQTRARDFLNERVKRILETIPSAQILSSNAIEFAIQATERTKNCTELNYGITASTFTCLKAVESAIQNVFEVFKFKRSILINSIEIRLIKLSGILKQRALQELEDVETEILILHWAADECYIHELV